MVATLPASTRSALIDFEFCLIRLVLKPCFSNEVRTRFLVRINAGPQEYFANLGDTPPLVISDFLEFAFEFRRDAERQRRVFWHGFDFMCYVQIFNDSLAIAYIVCNSMYDIVCV